MKSALYEGSVRHRRLAPVGNAFRYRLFQVYLDLAELETVFRGRWLWSAKWPNVAWFRRKDHLGDPRQTLDEAVRDLVEQETGRRPAGPIRLLTHLRYFGYVMNPVSFYYCFDVRDERVETIVAEIHNTPWGERHCYVLTASANEGTDERKLFRIAKQFHVSPFMSMNQTYGWRFTEPGETLAVHMENCECGGKLFDATLTLERRPITGATLARALWAYPLMTVKVIAAIY
ncbi:MAG: DUF1365 domain-containing protein, partial [Myxococcales bacterium]|nr:DUF1365 domain-containing protein [Myxococcales bacterium]